MTHGSTTAAEPGGARTAPSMLYRVKQVELSIRAHLDEVVRPAGVTALQYTALTVLARRDGLTSAELARNSFVTPQAMADLVNALERSGLIERARDPQNRRQLLITLTPAGSGVLERCAEAVGAIEDRMLRGLGTEDRLRFRHYLESARRQLEH